MSSCKYYMNPKLFPCWFTFHYEQSQQKTWQTILPFKNATVLVSVSPFVSPDFLPNFCKILLILLSLTSIGSETQAAAIDWSYSKNDEQLIRSKQLLSCHGIIIPGFVLCIISAFLNYNYNTTGFHFLCKKHEKIDMSDMIFI